jgi:hypothetical protein
MTVLHNLTNLSSLITRLSTAVRAVVGVTADKRDRNAEASEGAHNIPII